MENRSQKVQERHGRVVEAQNGKENLKNIQDNPKIPTARHGGPSLLSLVRLFLFAKVTEQIVITPSTKSKTKWRVMGGSDHVF